MLGIIDDEEPLFFRIRKYKGKPKMGDIGDNIYIVGRSYERKCIKAKKRQRCKIHHQYWLRNLVKELDNEKDKDLIRSLIWQINHRNAI